MWLSLSVRLTSNKLFKCNYCTLSGQSALLSCGTANDRPAAAPGCPTASCHASVHFGFWSIGARHSGSTAAHSHLARYVVCHPQGYKRKSWKYGNWLLYNMKEYCVWCVVIIATLKHMTSANDK